MCKKYLEINEWIWKEKLELDRNLKITWYKFVLNQTLDLGRIEKW